MDWFDDVVLVATAGPKFTKAEIVENEVVKLYYMSFTCVLFSTVMEVFM
jgi:hypothetical protein